MTKASFNMLFVMLSLSFLTGSCSTISNVKCEEIDKYRKWLQVLNTAPSKCGNHLLRTELLVYPEIQAFVASKGNPNGIRFEGEELVDLAYSKDQVVYSYNRYNEEFQQYRFSEYPYGLPEWLTATPPPPPSEKRIALVVGNATYTGNLRSLPNPVRDVQGMSAALTRLGFDVITVANATRARFLEEIATFDERLKDYKIRLFYYSGHGLQSNGENYLIPIEAHVESKYDIQEESIPLGQVFEKMDSMGDTVNIVILDACRDNPLPGFEKGLADIRSMPTNLFIMYAARPGQIAFDVDAPNKHSFFTEALLQSIETCDLPIEELAKRVIGAVWQSTAGAQLPILLSGSGADFYFCRNRK